MTTALTPQQAVDRLDEIAHRSTAEEQAAKNLSSVKTRMIVSGSKNPNDAAKCVFFGSLVMRLSYEPKWDIDTAATDGRRVVYNPDFINGLTEAELTGVLVHEVMHCCNKHFARRHGREMQRFNIGADAAINPVIKEAGFTLPKGALFPGEGMLSAMPNGLSMEEYYALLPEPSPDDEPGDDPGGCGGVTEQDGESDNPSDSADQKQLDREWTSNVAAAQQAAEKRGTLSAGLQRLCGEALAPSRDWKAELRHYLTRTAKDAYSWKRPNRRFLHRGLFLPSRHSTSIGHVVVVIDTSGSISADTLTRFASEVGEIAAQGVEKITTVYHHSEVYKAEEWTAEEGPYTVGGCVSGGTDHKPVFRHIDAMEEPPVLVVCLTDMESSFPKTAPEYPVLWASINQKSKAPFGDILFIPPV